jgi:hypothetical protein
MMFCFSKATSVGTAADALELVERQFKTLVPCPCPLALSRQQFWWLMAAVMPATGPMAAVFATRRPSHSEQRSTARRRLPIAQPNALAVAAQSEILVH